MHRLQRLASYRATLEIELRKLVSADCLDDAEWLMLFANVLAEWFHVENSPFYEDHFKLLDELVRDYEIRNPEKGREGLLARFTLRS